MPQGFSLSGPSLFYTSTLLTFLPPSDIFPRSSNTSAFFSRVTFPFLLSFLPANTQTSGPQLQLSAWKYFPNKNSSFSIKRILTFVPKIIKTLHLYSEFIFSRNWTWTEYVFVYHGEPKDCNVWGWAHPWRKDKLLIRINLSTTT